MHHHAGISGTESPKSDRKKLKLEPIPNKTSATLTFKVEDDSQQPKESRAEPAQEVADAPMELEASVDSVSLIQCIF